jgi:hypothetical protein
MTLNLNQPLVLVIDGPQARELLAAIGEAIRDGRAIVVPGESVEEAPVSRPGLAKVQALAPQLRRVG